MHQASVVSRAIAAGVISIVSNVADAGTGFSEPVPIKDRLFFERGDWVREFAPVEPAATGPARAPAEEAAQSVPVRMEPADRSGASRVALPIRLAELSWAPTPPVPQLLSKPLLPVERLEVKLPVLEDREEKVLQQALSRRAAKPPVYANLERKKPLTEYGRLPITKLSRERMSTRWGDPLAMLEIEEEGAREPAPEFIMPFANGRVTSLFNQGRRHPAIDLAGKLGSPVLSTTEHQTVVFTGWRGGYGYAVITRDPTGRMHLYGHLKSITSRVGQVLAQGDKLGHLGSTGRSTGPHVHYEVRTPKGVHINPVTLLFPGRKISKGLAWADVDQFGSPVQVAGPVPASERVASANVPEAEPRRSRAKRKSRVRQYTHRARQYRTAGYSYRSRRASSDDGE
jgi:murein DD-endopeptidase MepM/ murein hydrolase activator NlpD